MARYTRIRIIQLNTVISLVVVLVAASLAGRSACAQTTGVPPSGSWIRDAKGCAAAADLVPQPNESIQWTGHCKHGRIEGHGVLTWLINGALDLRETGDFKNGKRDGRSVVEWFDKGGVLTRRAEGDFKEGELDGHGVIEEFVKDGVATRRDEGNYKDGKLDGHGTVVLNTGFKLDGNFKDGFANGFGSVVYPNGNRYEGEFRDSDPNGEGIYLWPNGNRYKGEMKDGLVEGRGLITYADGGTAQGNFKDGRLDGYGQVVYANGRHVEGTFRNGQYQKDAEDIANDVAERNARSAASSDTDGVTTNDDPTSSAVASGAQSAASRPPSGNPFQAGNDIYAANLAAIAARNGRYSQPPQNNAATPSYSNQNSGASAGLHFEPDLQRCVRVPDNPTGGKDFVNMCNTTVTISYYVGNTLGTASEAGSVLDVGPGQTQHAVSYLPYRYIDFAVCRKGLGFYAADGQHAWITPNTPFRCGGLPSDF